MMEGRTAEVGRTARPMGMACVRGLRAKASTQGPGNTASRCQACTHGRRVTRTKVSGFRARGTASGQKPRDGGYTVVSGLKASRGVTVYDSPLRLEPGTKGHGPLDCRMDMGVKATQMEVGIECSI